MTTIPLNCEGFAEAVADYLERDDTPRIRAAVETHAASCAECGALLADLQQLRVDASGLPTLSPSRDLWAGIAERIETPVVAIGEGRGTRGEGRGTRRMPVWLRPVAAAAALVVITAGVTYVATREALLSGAQVASQPIDSAAMDPHKTVVAAVDSAFRHDGIVRSRTPERSDRSESRAPSTVNRPPASPLAPRPSALLAASLASNPTPAVAAVETVYGREIARLRRIVDERRAQLDTATVGVLERNLNVIDQAIRESRAALARDPASAFLNEQLTNVLEQKVELLRAAAVLPVRT